MPAIWRNGSAFWPGRRWLMAALLLGWGWLLVVPNRPATSPDAYFVSWREQRSLQQWRWARVDAVNGESPAWWRRVLAQETRLPVSPGLNRVVVTLRTRDGDAPPQQSEATLDCPLRPGGVYALAVSFEHDAPRLWLLDGAQRPLCGASPPPLRDSAQRPLCGASPPPLRDSANVAWLPGF